MKAAFIEQTGPAENITFGELPEPSPSGREVLVKVAAVAVNPIDTYIRSGTSMPSKSRQSVSCFSVAAASAKREARTTPSDGRIGQFV